MRLFAASVAAIALAATGAVAQPDKGKGNGGEGNRGNAAAKVERGPSQDRGKGSSAPKMDRAGEQRGPDMRGNGNGRSQGNDERGGNGQADRASAKGVGERGNWQDDRRDLDRVRDSDRAIGYRDDDDRVSVRFVDRGDNFSVFRDYDRREALYEGCPPGLAKKYNGCMPPGLAKQEPYYRPAYFGYSGYDDRRFYYDDGFLFGLGRDGRIAASIPLLGGALSVGNVWPSYYSPVEVRPYYRDFYGLETDGYRYANDVLYRVDPTTSAITSIAALLTGDDFVVGQPVPRGYDVYNVPYQYRDRYADGPDGYYRYADGYVYRVDPETQLVAAAIQLLVG